MRNAWYVLALTQEVTATRPMARTVLEEPLAVYRHGNNVVVFEDRCCHRQFPLSKGHLEPRGLRCGYHGLLFADDGQCIEIPSQETVPSAARVRVYPTVERYGWIWVWMGDPKVADIDQIPDYSWVESPRWQSASDRYHIKCNYRLIIQNLLDSTHLPFVHGTTIGNPQLCRADVQFAKNANEVLVTRWTLDAPAPLSYQKARPVDGNVDRWQNLHFYPPAYCRFHVGAAPVGARAPEGGGDQRMNWMNLNAVTPETASTSHYFFAMAHDLEDPGKTELIINDARQAFLEDAMVLEAQQERRSDNYKELYLRADAGPAYAMRVLDKWIEKEAQDPSATLSAKELQWSPMEIPLPKRLRSNALIEVEEGA